MEDRTSWFLVSHAVGPGGRVEYLLKNGENLVGRKREADINLAHLDVSREHCVIFVTNNSTLALVDRKSRNGTFVNGLKVCADKSITLFENDSVGFGSNTTAVETYAEKTPFLVFRIVRKMPSIVFEEMAAMNRGKGLTKRHAETAPTCVPAIKRIKAEHGVTPVPICSSSRPSTEVSSTVTTEEPSTKDRVSSEPATNSKVTSAGIQVTRSLPDGMVECMVIDNEPEPNAGKVSDSTIQNGLTSDMETGTPSFRNSSVRTNDETRSTQKNHSRDSSAVGSSSKKVKSEWSQADPSSAKVGLFKLPLIEIKSELRSGTTPPPSPVLTSPGLSNASRNSEILTFSLISDDEDDDDMMMSSQMFIKTEPESQHLVQMPEDVIDDEVYEIFDSDDESLFENHLSQSFSQSFMLPEEPLKEVKQSGKPKTEKDSVKTDNKIETKKKDSIRRSSSKDDSASTKASKADAASSKKTSVKSDNKKTEDIKKSTKKFTKAATKKTQGESKDVPKSASRRSVEEDPQMTLRSKPIKVSDKADRFKVLTSSSEERKSSADSNYPVKTSSKNEVDKIVQKMIDDSKRGEIPKKAVLISPQSLPSKENKSSKPVANGAVVRNKKQLRVTFKEIPDVKEFECQGNMKKISTMPTHLLKEHPPKQPALQWNPLLLRGCGLVGDICQWNLKWLHEFQMVEKDPPLIEYEPVSVANQFKEFKDYYFTMVALMLHELWSEMCRVHLFQTESQKFPLFSGIIEHMELNFDARTLFCRVKVVCSSSDVPALPNFGDLVGIEILAPDHKQTHIYSSFGVVTRQYSKERLQPSRQANFLINNLVPDKSNIDKSIVCPIEVLFRASKTNKNNVSRDCFVRIRVYKNIMNQVKYFLALNKVNKSPLKSIILDPTKAVETCRTTESRKDERIYGQEYLTTTLNQLQREAVLGIANSVLNEESSISLIHGPPGTGKSSTIASLIVHLLPILRRGRKSLPIKILLCAPSNNAIDELCLKLLEVRKKLRGYKSLILFERTDLCQIEWNCLLSDGNFPFFGGCQIVHLSKLVALGAQSNRWLVLCVNRWNTAHDLSLLWQIKHLLHKECVGNVFDEEKFKLTRVGNIKIMHPLVTDISSHKLALRALSNTPDPQSLETEMTLLAARIQAGRNSLFSSNIKPLNEQRIRENIEKCETRLGFYSKTLANIRSGRPPSNPEEDRKLFSQEESFIISGAEIIATTLSSSISKKISDAICDSNQFSCCIVDEATQATEPEVLIPLNHNVRHLVLVGDPQQLGPTVTSKFAKERNFEWSLYHRLMAEWKQYRGTPLYPLREQYRMHAEIAAFPSKKFYNAELRTPSYLKVDLPFSPYQIISHSWSESAAEESNEKEGRFIVDLVQKLKGLPEFKHLDVGIIVPYQNQNRFIRKVIEDKRDRAFENVVVNTIDSFQGQEKDLIVLSCVRTKRIGFLSDYQRLNVALTRAKKCLLVVGNFQALKSDEFWGAMIADAKSRNRFFEANANDRIAPGIIFSKLFSKSKMSKRQPHHSRT